jgi:hypothetical protein
MGNSQLVTRDERERSSRHPPRRHECDLAEFRAGAAAAVTPSEGGTAWHASPSWWMDEAPAGRTVAPGLHSCHQGLSELCFGVREVVVRAFFGDGGPTNRALPSRRRPSRSTPCRTTRSQRPSSLDCSETRIWVQPGTPHTRAAHGATDGEGHCHEGDVNLRHWAPSAAERAGTREWPQVRPAPRRRPRLQARRRRARRSQRFQGTKRCRRRR